MLSDATLSHCLITATKHTDDLDIMTELSFLHLLNNHQKSH